LKSSFLPSVATLPPVVRRAPAKATSNSTSPYREKSSSALSRLCGTGAGRGETGEQEQVMSCHFARSVSTPWWMNRMRMQRR
jgi:hypothetical protein